MAVRYVQTGGDLPFPALEETAWQPGLPSSPPAQQPRLWLEEDIPPAVVVIGLPAEDHGVELFLPRPLAGTIYQPFPCGFLYSDRDGASAWIVIARELLFATSIGPTLTAQSITPDTDGSDVVGPTISSETLP